MTAHAVWRNCRLPEGALVDITVADGVVAAVEPARGMTEAMDHDAGGWLAVPSLVEPHVHLDKTFLGCSWQPHLPGAGIAERIRLEKEARRAVAEPVAVRGAQLLDRIVAAGVGHVRSHVDIDPDWGLANLEAVRDLRERYAAALDIQIVAFPQSGILSAPGTAELLDAALGAGADLVGGLDPAGIDGEPVRHLDTVFALAERHGKGVDIHLHDGGELGCFELGLVAERARALSLGGRVTVSHAFCLGEVPAAVAARVAATLAEAGVAVLTAVPGGAMPPLRLLAGEGVLVMAGSDNVRDAWSPLGTGDVLERAKLAAWREDWRTDADLAFAFDLVSRNAARGLGIDAHGIAVGNPADLALLNAVSVPAAVAEPPAGRLTLKRGRPTAGAPV